MDHAVAAAPGAGRVDEEHERAKLGTWLFLASEIMFFAGFFSAFIVLKMSRPESVFDNSHLNKVLAGINTIALICSSFTMVLAVDAAKKGKGGQLRLGLLATALLGALFLCIKFFEYSHKFESGIYPSTNVFYGAYFLMTGFHGFHVFGGVVAMFLLLINARKWGPTNFTHVECVGLYWHFVDVVWIFLFPVLYLMK